MELRLAEGSPQRGDTVVAFGYAGPCPANTQVAGVKLGKLEIPKNVGQSVTLRADDAEVLVVSLGKKEEFTLDRLRQAGGAVAVWSRERKVPALTVDYRSVAAEQGEDGLWAVCEGLLLGDFVFQRHKSSPADRNHARVTVLTERVSASKRQRLERITIACRAANLTRDIAHEPPNEIKPQDLVVRARKIASSSHLKCTVLDEKQMAKLKMGGILAVGQGSAAPPRLIILEYAGSKKGAPIVLIGKAITFDTGGYSLKTTEGIVGMKYDKCGGAAVLGVMQAVAELKPRCRVVGIIAAAENMIAPDSYRPDDIVRTLSGKTVEIVSTDAEGRMVLADALTYAQQKYKPRAMIDLATLTGGMVVALGKFAAGLFCENDELREALLDSSIRTHERLWPMPLWDDYNELIKGDDADIKNSGGRWASPVVGGVFLKNFVDKRVPWAHLDIAGTATVDENKPYCPKGATGFGVRLLCDYLMHL